MRWDHSGTRCTITGSMLAPRLFGLVFGGLGLVFTIALLRDPGSITVNDRPGTRADIWMPMIFVLIGLAIAGIRHRREITCMPDGGLSSTAHSGWGPFMRTRRIDHGAVQAVQLEKEVRRTSSGKGGSRTHVVYPVQAVCGMEPCSFQAPRSYQRARAQAEDLAKRLRVDLIDKSTTEAVRRSWETVDQSVVEQVHAEDLDVPVPPQTGMHIEDEGLRTRIALPRPPRVLWTGAGLAVPVIGIPLGFWWFLWRPAGAEQTDPSLFGTIFIYAPLILFLGVPLIRILARGFLTEHLMVDRHGLRLGVRHLPAEEIEEITVVDGGDLQRRLRITTDRLRVSTAHGYAVEELRYLPAVLLRKMAG